MAKKMYYGWWIVIACFLLSFYIGGVIFFGFTAFFEPLREEFGWSYTQISLASSLRGLEMGIWAPIVGFLVDRYGPRKIIFLGILTTGLGLVLLAFTQSLLMFYGIFLLVSLGAGGCAAVALTTVIANWFTKNLGKALGVMASGFGAAGLIVPVIVYLIHRYGWRTACICMGVGMWIIGLLVVMVIRNGPSQDDTLLENGTTGTKTTLSHKDPSGESFRLKEILFHRTFVYLNLAEAVRLLILTAATLHVMPYLSSLGISRTMAAAVAAAIPLCSIIGRLGFGWIADYMNKRVVMAVAFGLMSFGMLMYSCIQIHWLIPFFLLTFSPGFGGSMVVRGAILREYFGQALFGRLVGIIMGSAAVGGIIGPTLAGWVFDVFGDYRLIWVGFSVMAVIALHLILLAKPIKR